MLSKRRADEPVFFLPAGSRPGAIELDRGVIDLPPVSGARWRRIDVVNAEMAKTAIRSANALIVI
jgi:hypothetical protein